MAEKITVVDAKKLNKKQLNELRQRTKEYAPLEDYTKPFPINLKTGKNKWLCALNQKGNVIGFVRMGINHSTRTITSYDRYVMPKYQRQEVGTKMLVRQIAIARGLGRYSIRIDWLDPHTSLKMINKLGLILQKKAEKRKGKGRIKAGLTVYKFKPKDRHYLAEDYGNGNFTKGLENYRKAFPNEAVFRDVPAKHRGNKGAISDAWIQLSQGNKPRTNTKTGKKTGIRNPPGPKKFGKSLFTPKIPKNRWRNRK